MKNYLNFVDLLWERRILVSSKNFFFVLVFFFTHILRGHSNQWWWRLDILRITDYFSKNFKSSFTLGWSVQLGLFDGGNIDKNEGTIMMVEGKFYSVTEDNLDSSSLESCWPLLVAYLGVIARSYCSYEVYFKGIGKVFTLWTTTPLEVVANILTMWKVKDLRNTEVLVVEGIRNTFLCK